ncbi:hypothetical protein [Bacillus toyonensis]|uniref:hypothetical protein n=1 Tax=Bacillus toyonensis TaxID=155322 RepID=UPI002E20A7F3|nr:hypothetical protein [Bacillus toyonensis]
MQEQIVKVKFPETVVLNVPELNWLKEFYQELSVEDKQKIKEIGLEKCITYPDEEIKVRFSESMKIVKFLVDLHDKYDV